jgi:four helix bundle protein
MKVRRQETGDRRQGIGDRRQETGDRRGQETGGNRRLGELPMAVQSVKQLNVYTKAYALAMRVFLLSKKFPPEERYALTCQIRRSSRSVCMNLREAWAKRMYPMHFVNKLSDCDGEINETDTSLDFARDCEYITTDEHRELTMWCSEVGRMLGAMIKNPDPFLLPTLKMRLQETGIPSHDDQEESGER